MSKHKTFTKEEHEERRKQLGASDVPTILGLNPFQSPYGLWALKQGIAEPDGGSAATDLGRRLEPAILDQAEEDLGALNRDVKVAHKTLPLVATLDGQVIETQHVVEAKTAGLMAGYSMDDWGDEGRVIHAEQVPKRYFVQVHAQLMCTGAELAHLYGLVARRGITMLHYEIEPDKKFIDWLSRFIDDWWERHMIRGEEPPITLAKMDELKRLSRTDDVIDLDDDVERVLAEYQHWSTVARDATKQKEERQRLLVASLGKATAGRLTDGTEIRMDLVARKGYTVQPSEYRQFKVKSPKKAKVAK